ncbi:11711_t:CDS:2 [Funneliformis mosseae]|uniref:11711_t:CDS:1 n=1 Tax=Funneliformis mosseae TaxID=27381 RepID=A0A9N8VDV7_FUNMO|nr:11711_t:CDS:2 [Funneliformis mosseae]
MKYFLPLFKLPKRYYDPSLLKSRKWSPWNFPSRKRRIYVGLIFDWALIIVMFLLTDWFFKTPQPPIAYFSVEDNSLKKPIVNEIISSSLATIINTVLPGFIMLLLEFIFFYDFWNCYHMLTGHVTSIVLALFFTSLSWITIGSHLGLRPTFLTRCQPDMSQINAMNETQTYFTSEICTNKLSKIEYQGFPSGHSATAYAGWVFFVLYINGKSKPWTGGAHFWKVLVLLFPIYFATWISLTRVMDYRHFPFQIITGGLIGIGAALISYRLHFGNNGWFLGTGDGSDHIPAHYKYLEDWDSVDNRNEVVNINDNERDLERNLSEVSRDTDEEVHNKRNELNNQIESAST